MPAEIVLARLRAEDRAFVHLHSVVMVCIAFDVSGVEQLPGLLRACLAYRVALVGAARSAGLNVADFMAAASTGGIAEVSAAFDGEPDEGRASALFERVAMLDERYQALLQDSPSPTPGPEFDNHVQRVVAFDALILLILRALAEGGERSELLDVAEQLLEDLEQAPADHVVLPGIGPRPDPSSAGAPTVLLPDDLERAARVAFSREAVRDARQILAQGRAWFPDDPGLARREADLAPPRVTARTADPNEREAWRRNRAWVLANERAFAGKWVAVSDGDLLASADRPGDLPQDLPPRTLIARVGRG
jgi:hypothetical protein